MSHHERGNPTFVQFVTGINLAQIGWDQFRDKVRFAETQYNEKLDAARTNVAYVEHRIWLNVIINNFLDPVRRVVEVAWFANYWLSILMVIAGLGMLYLNSVCVYDYLLLVPPAAYLGLSYIMLAVVLAVLRIFDAFVDRYTVEKEAEKFVKAHLGHPPTMEEMKQRSEERVRQNLSDQELNEHWKSIMARIRRRRENERPTPPEDQGLE